MSRVNQLKDTLFVGDRKGADIYGRIFVVSAFGGITNLLLEHKKSGEPGVYAHLALRLLAWAAPALVLT